MTHTADVVVVGGGPAGAAAAIAPRPQRARASIARRQGHVPAGQDLRRRPDRRCAAPARGPRARPSAIPSWKPVDDVVVRSPSGREVTFPLPRGAGLYAVVARRVELDAALARRRPGGRRRGARRATPASPPRSTTTESCSRSRGSAPSRRATPSAPTACGRRCASTSASAMPGYRGEWHAFRQYFTGVGPPASDDAVRVVRARPPPGLRLVVPAARRPGQRRLRHPARRRQGRPRAGHEGRCGPSC